jgi:hypothetical protein
MLWVLIVVLAVTAWLFVNGNVGPKRRRHQAAWDPFREARDDGTSLFQQKAEASLREALEPRGVHLVNYERRPITASSAAVDITAGVSDTSLTIGIYLDGAQISGPGIDERFEDEDAPTPDDLVREFTDKAVALVESHRNPPDAYKGLDLS